MNEIVSTVSETINFLNNQYSNKKLEFNRTDNLSDSIEGIYVDNQLLQRKREIREQLQVFDQINNIGGEFEAGAKDIFSLLGNMRSILIQNIGGYDINKKALQNKISDFLGEIDNLSRIKFNEVQLLNGSLNVNFLLFNRNYNLNFNKDFSVEGLDLNNPQINNEYVKKIENAQKSIIEEIEKSNDFRKELNQNIEEALSPKKENSFSSFLKNSGLPLQGNLINLSV